MTPKPSFRVRSDSWFLRVRGVGSFRLTDAGTVQHLNGKEWRPISMQSLARDYAPDHEVWQWLRSNDITRPSPSGPTVPESERGGCRVRLDDNSTAHADVLAVRWNCSRTAVVARALLYAICESAGTRTGEGK